MYLSTPEQSGVHPQSIVSQIRDLFPLPRHAIFHVKLVIHQLSSVPLTTGQFRVKWKFRNSQAVNSAGRPLGLGRVLARKLEKRHTSGNGNSNGKGKGKEVAHGEHMLSHEHELPADINGREETQTPLGRPGSSHSSSQSSISKRSSSGFTHPPGSQDVDYRSEARGYTPFLPLREFNVAFDHQVDVAVQMSIDKDSLALLSSDLKLTVMQRVIPGDPDSPLNPRLGHVQINLAEYADAGSVTRNYLLRRSKVNAILNMTITMTQISGADDYRAPPLRKEEIGAGLTEYVSLSEPIPALSRFIHTEDPWLDECSDLLSPWQVELPPPEPPSSTDPPTREKKGRWHVPRRSKSGAQTDPPPAPRPTQKEQLHPTEALIEAIFNPIPSSSPTQSPFTYYVPPAPPTSSEGTDGTGRGSFDSSRQASVSPSASVRANASEVGHESPGGGSRVNKWWRRNAGSMPATPTRSNSTRS